MCIRDRGVSVCPAGALPGKLAETVVRVANEAITSRGRFTVALAGGSLPKQLCPGLLALREQIDFTKWHVFFGDERFVPATDPESTWKAFNEALFSEVDIPAEQIYTLHSLPESTTLQEAASWYEHSLLKYKHEGQDTPCLDLVFCGMGPDGHTCSLFPGHPLLQERSCLVASISDSPKPPPERITITMPVIQAARSVFFVAVGGGKAEMLPLILGNHRKRSAARHEEHLQLSLEVEDIGSEVHPGCDMSLPCARVCNMLPPVARIDWFVDDAAAAKLLEESKL
eukprot:TRINITY_DN1201_c0_g1_i2.p1 TRINITY_DN1201_c0_g1~~TRINITY_DN1201_c0_g1_i2.p1  ORF type:complete len:284 (-),score=85.71 TRINITY_DN1201_c0_g1_i2:305-1156(-)